jgi:D-galactarolactone cycloisomerase
VTTSQERHLTRDVLLVEVESDTGVSGWGECAGPPALLAPIIHQFFADSLLRRDALQTELRWHQLWRQAYRWGRRGLMVAALSGLDMALWDLKGHVLKRPCSEMMGGRQFDRIPCYATGLLFRDRPEAELIPLLIEEATSYIEAGYRGVKAQIGRNISFDLALIRRLREHLPRAILMADAGHAYDLPEAILVAQALQEARFAWLEDPLSPEHPEHFRVLADRVALPLCAGEWEQTRWGFHDLLANGGVLNAQVNMAFCGGPTEALHIRSLTQSRGINLTPVGTGSMLNAAAALHFAAAEFRLPGRLEPMVGMIGWTVSLDSLSTIPFARGISIENGMASVPSTPGWGVTIDKDMLRSVCVHCEETSA